jgi:hypothetical protein
MGISIGVSCFVMPNCLLIPLYILATSFAPHQVRNAFGNYLDILKEVSYSPLMAEMLTYLGSKSTAYVFEKEKNVEFADENYAREILQLFTTGLFKLHKDGTRVLDEDGIPLRVYSNDDIESYARAWTGFVPHGQRGNIETTPRYNKIDPMQISAVFRDLLPKMGLDRTYIGDGYPLCADLPTRHFLVKGATYRLLGRRSEPELISDPLSWINNPDAVRFSLQPNGRNSLFAKLCHAGSEDQCQFPAEVVLNTTVDCNSLECSVDTVRTVEVNGMFFEYIRPPCVHQAFFSDAKKLVTSSGRNALCGDPRMESAAAKCCVGNSNDNDNIRIRDETVSQLRFVRVRGVR